MANHRKTNMVLPGNKKKKLPVPRYEIKRARNKELFWRFIGKNGEQISRGSETYKRRAGVMKSINIMRGSAGAVVHDTTMR